MSAPTHPDPYPYYEDLVRRPIHRLAGNGPRIVAGADAVRAVLTSELCRARPADEPVPRALAGSLAGDLFGALVRMTDGSGHCPLKRAVVSALDMLDETRIREAARSQVCALMEDLGSEPDRKELDRIIGFLPSRAVGVLLGVRAHDLDALSRSAAALSRAFAPGATEAFTQAAGPAALELLSLSQRSCEGGLIDVLVEEVEGFGAGAREAALANGIGFLFQAHDAIAGLIGNTLLSLARSASLRVRVRAEPASLAAVVREVSRWDPPIQNTRRFVARSGRIAGVEMLEGETIVLLLAAANRHAALDRDAAAFGPFRARPPASLTFGAGVHRCPGERIALMIATAAIERLLAAGVDPARLETSVCYRRSQNARIPIFEKENT